MFSDSIITFIWKVSVPGMFQFSALGVSLSLHGRITEEQQSKMLIKLWPIYITEDSTKSYPWRPRGSLLELLHLLEPWERIKYNWWCFCTTKKLMQCLTGYQRSWVRLTWASGWYCSGICGLQGAHKQNDFEQMDKCQTLQTTWRDLVCDNDCDNNPLQMLSLKPA